ncbi:MAG: restriction endonuclease subunit S [Bacteroidota bacterium]
MKSPDCRLMNKEKKKMMAPKLRFPEFQEEGEWPYKNGDSVFAQVSNKNHDSDLPLLAITQEHGAIPRDEIDYSVIVTDKSVESYKVVEIGDFIISLRSFQGGIEYSNYKGICSPAYIILRKKNDVEDTFFKYYFKTDLFIQDLNKNIEGIRDGKMVSYKQFSELLLPMPSKGVQQKIASFLASVDTLITAQTQKVHALQAHKKGLMQWLFPAEGEMVPRVRFREFERAGEWEEKKLGEKTIKVGSGITPKGGDKTYIKEGRPFVRSQNVGWGYLILENIAFIDEATHSTFLSTEIKAGDVLLNITGASIGRSAIADTRIRGGNVNQHVCIIRTNKELSPFFLSQYLLSDNGQKQIDSFQAGGNRQGLNFEQIRTLSIPLPPKKDEQQKIADCLSSLDDLITAQTQKLEALKTQKKGLMQQLFPNLNDL